MNARQLLRTIEARRTEIRPILARFCAICREPITPEMARYDTTLCAGCVYQSEAEAYYQDQYESTLA